MNVDRVQPSALWAPRATKAAGQRVDFTVSSPADPEAAGKPAPAGDVPRAGTLQGLLSVEESRAIADLFGPSARVYSPDGGLRQHAHLPGVRFDAHA